MTILAGKICIDRNLSSNEENEALFINNGTSFKHLKRLKVEDAKTQIK